MTWLQRYLTRLGRVWFENPVWLVGYTLRLAAAMRFTLVEFVSPNSAATLARKLTTQTVKTFFRGVFLVVALSVAAAGGVGWISARLGALARGPFEELVVPLLVSHVLPLALAVVLIARTGSTVAVSFAAQALKDGGPIEFPPRTLQHVVLPHVVASAVTAGVFYLIAVWLVLVGYHVPGLRSLGSIDLSAYLSPSAAWPPLGLGIRKALAFGIVVAVTASGLGIRVAEQYDPLDSDRGAIHYVVWESAVIAAIVCTFLTIVL